MKFAKLRNSPNKNQKTAKNVLLLVAAALFIGLATHLTLISRAASNGFYFSPASQSMTVGTTFNVQVRLNTTSATDTVQTYISYPSNLEVVGLPTVTEPYESDYENNTATPGLIKIVRSDFSGTPQPGDRLISTITFKAKVSGSAVVSFTNNSYGVSNGQQQSIPLNNANYTISNTAASPAPNPAPPPVASPVAPPTAPPTTSRSSSSPPPVASSQPRTGSTGSTAAPSATQAAPQTPSPGSQPGSTASQPIAAAGAPATGTNPSFDDARAPLTDNPELNSENSAVRSGLPVGLIAAIAVPALLLAGGVSLWLLRSRGYTGFPPHKPDFFSHNNTPSNSTPASTFSYPQANSSLPGTGTTVYPTNAPPENVVVRPTNADTPGNNGVSGEIK